MLIMLVATSDSSSTCLQASEDGVVRPLRVPSAAAAYTSPAELQQSGGWGSAVIESESLIQKQCLVSKVRFALQIDQGLLQVGLPQFCCECSCR